MAVVIWEYETHQISDYVLVRPNELKERLNAWGAQGYELVSVACNAYGAFMFFKRPKNRD